MKNLLKTSALAAFFLFAASLKNEPQTDAPRYKNEGYFIAKIDGKAFDSRGYDKYTAEVTNTKTGQSADLTFFGGNYYDQNGNVFGESLQFKYAFTGNNVNELNNQKLVFQFNNQKFLSIPGQTQIKVTKMHFNADKTAMIMSADFEGKMLQWTAPGQAQAIVTVKGKMENINVSVPADRPTADL